MTQVVVALGGNLGDPVETFRQACARLRREPGLHDLETGRVFRSAPVGSAAGPPFLNTVCRFESDLEPLVLLDRLQAIETALGRTRERHWGPRTLDLDLIFFGDQVIRHPRLTVPHPHGWYRRFVLDPLAELAPDLIHPEAGLTVSELRSRLLPRPLRVLIGGPLPRAALEQLVLDAAQQFPDAQLEAAPIPAPAPASGSVPVRSPAPTPVRNGDDDGGGTEPDPAAARQAGLAIWFCSADDAARIPPLWLPAPADAPQPFLTAALTAALNHCQPLNPR